VSSFQVSLIHSHIRAAACLLTTHNIAQLAYEDIDIHFHILALRYDAMRRNQAKYYIIKFIYKVYEEREGKYPSEYHHKNTTQKRESV
jgi:hypothetical protein